MSRRRYMFCRETKEMVEVGADWSDAERRAPTVTEELVYGGAGTATDGTPINSRKKHREYMKANGLALASDYTEAWAKAEKWREDFKAGRHLGAHNHPGLREAIGRAVDKVRGRKP